LGVLWTKHAWEDLESKMGLLLCEKTAEYVTVLQVLLSILGRRSDMKTKGRMYRYTANQKWNGLDVYELGGMPLLIAVFDF